MRYPDHFRCRLIVGLLCALLAAAASAEDLIRIHDELGPGQVSESLTVTIGGVSKSLSIDTATPTAVIEFACPAPEIEVSLRSTTVFEVEGQRTSFEATNEGSVHCDGVMEFDFAGDLTEDGMYIRLDPRPEDPEREPELQAQTAAPRRSAKLGA